MIRIMRFVGVLRDLRLMMLAIMNSAVPLFWALVFLIVVFLQAVTLHLETAPADDLNYEGMNVYFPSLVGCCEVVPRYVYFLCDALRLVRRVYAFDCHEHNHGHVRERRCREGEQ